MNTDNTTSTVNKEQQEDFIRLQDLWAMFLPKWRWFVLSLFVCLSLAVLYIMSTPPSYTRTASILVKDNEKNGSGIGSVAMNEFQDMGLFTSSTNINNELLTIQSPTLMGEVVKRLKLDETYTVSEGLRTRELYRNTPVLVTFNHATVQPPVSFTIRLQKDGKKALLSEFKAAGEEYSETYEVVYGDSIATPAGVLTLTLSGVSQSDWVNTPIRYAKGSFKNVTDAYTAQLAASLGDKKATIINLTISNPSPKKAEDILNTLIEVYNESWIQDKNQIAVSTSHFITDRLGVIENELGHVDDNISAYKSENLLPDVQAVAGQFLQQSAANKKELLELNSQLSIMQYLRKVLDRKDFTQPLPTNAGMSNADLQSQISTYNNTLLDRNRLLANSSERNPLVQDLTMSLEAMQIAIVSSVDNAVASLNMQIRDLRSQEATTQGQLASNPQQARHLLSVERQQKVKEQLYLYLLQKREENELSQAFTAYNTRVITAPRGSSSPTAPKKMHILLAAFVLGLIIPAGSIFMIESMNTRVRGRKDVEGLNIPFVGEIPLTKEEMKRRKHQFTKRLLGKHESRKHEIHPLVVKARSRNIINEAFRVVRTNLEFMANSAESNHKTIIISSLNPSSGKTFITLNLSTGFAIKDKKVIAIDLDMRRASLSSYVNSPKTGISNYLSGQVADWKDVVVKDATHPGLDLLPVGTLPPNPTELLFSTRLEALFTALRQEYDYIFIDCPPVEMVADTSIIAKWADITLFVVRVGLMEREMLTVVDTIYREKKYPNMGILLNGSSNDYSSRYGYHRYGYRYGYNYGYGGYGNEE